MRNRLWSWMHSGHGGVQIHLWAWTPGVDPTQQQPLHAEHQGASNSISSSSASRGASSSVSSSSSDIVAFVVEVMLVPGVDPTEQQGLHAGHKGCSSIRTCEWISKCGLAIQSHTNGTNIKWQLLFLIECITYQIVENRPIPEKTINNLGRFSHLFPPCLHLDSLPAPPRTPCCCSTWCAKRSRRRMSEKRWDRAGQGYYRQMCGKERSEVPKINLMQEARIREMALQQKQKKEAARGVQVFTKYFFQKLLYQYQLMEPYKVIFLYIQSLYLLRQL